MANCIRCKTGTCVIHAANVNPTGDEPANINDSDIESADSPDIDEDDDEDSSNGPRKRYRRNKPDAALKDQQSTGRKRAARLYPLSRESSCEWRLSARAGGGDKPILGCFDGLQQARHHGPDKNTLNNEPGNVHRICHTCHNTWHARNDPDYDPNQKLRD